MNSTKRSEYDYINFPVVTQRAFSAVEVTRSYTKCDPQPAHDAYMSLLQRLPRDSEAL